MLKKILSILFCLSVLGAAFSALPLTANANGDGKTNVTYEVILNTAASMIRSHEGNYDSVNPDDNGALSIGCLQWHAGRALNLCRSILEKDPEGALAILGESLYNEILDPATVWSYRTLFSDKNVSDDETDRMSDFISTDIGIAEQDALIKKDVSAYLDRAIGLGITDPAALVYFADVENQCGSGGSRRIAAAAAEIAGSYGDITLDILHEAALADSAAGQYATRRNKAYNSCLVLGWSEFSSELEIWTLKSTRNVRLEPDTLSPLVTAIYKGTNVVITEKVYFDGLTRGKTSMGWLTLDLESCTLNEELSGGYVPAPVIFDTNGGHFFEKGENYAKITEKNALRGTNGLILYNSEGEYSQTPTNEHGTEVVIGADQRALSDPVYGANHTQIPEDGYILSGHGEMSTWLHKNIAKGSYLYLDEDALCIWAFSDYTDYRKMTGIRGSVDHINSGRPSNTLVVFTADSGLESAPTNSHGCEISVDSSGKVLNDPVYGTCNSKIPEGGFVLSGHGDGFSWIYNNVKKGDYIVFDKNAREITVCQSIRAVQAQSQTATYGTVFGSLPIPERARYYFGGWYAEGDDQLITEESVCTSALCITLKASWSEDAKKEIRFDTNGGVFKGVLTKDVNAVNSTRLENYLVVYKGKESSGTNIHGSEAVVDSSGKIVAVYHYGNGNAVIPKDGFVISGHGTMSQWISNNLKAGMLAFFDEQHLTVTVYEASVYEAMSKTAFPGEPVGFLPDAEKEYHKFLGWYTEGGERITSSSLMKYHDLTLIAKWEVLPADVVFSTDKGVLAGKISTATLSGIDTDLGKSSLVLYRERKITNAPAGSAAAVISKDGTVVLVTENGKGIKVPEGCFVICASASEREWLLTLKTGNHISISSNILTLWKDHSFFSDHREYTAVYGSPIGRLPTAFKEGWRFLGWTDKYGSTVNEDTVISQYGTVTLFAKWERLTRVTFAGSRGDVEFANAGGTISGINAPLPENGIVLYTGIGNTKTEGEVFEVLISRSGKVLSASYSNGTPIPEGCMVLSGHGKMAAWLKSNVFFGNYIIFSGNGFKVYETENALNAKGNELFVEKGSPIGALPKASAQNGTLDGWYLSDEKYTAKSTVSSDITLQAKWTRESAKLLFALAGGSFSSPCSTYRLCGINSSCPQDGVVLYTEDVSFKAGSAVSSAFALLDRNGRVIKLSDDPESLKIPENGSVLYACGITAKWLSANISQDDYVFIEENEMMISVFQSIGELSRYGKTVFLGEKYGPLPVPEREGYIFLGWEDVKKDKVNESSIFTHISTPVLIATWEKVSVVTLDTNGGGFAASSAAITGKNIGRGTNSLILYNDRSSTGTNIYGTEVIITGEGEVISCHYYGSGNNTIPAGCYALSGHGTMSAWLDNNISVGCYVTVEGNTVTVYKNKAAAEWSMAGGSVTVQAGASLDSVPIPYREGYIFCGWLSKASKHLSENTRFDEDSTFFALWKKK